MNKTNNFYEKFKKQKTLFSVYPKAMEYACAAQSYRDWLESKGYNVKCQHFTVDKLGNISCNLRKPLILCNGRCIDKTNK